MLGLYTGARLEELGQLRVKDVGVEDGIVYINITPDAGSVKTKGSKRCVPIHRDIAEKLVEYAGKLDPAGRLFPELRPDRFGSLSQNWSKRFGRYLRQTIRIEDKRKVFHSFRHSFKDACRAAGISEEVHDALTGHSSASVGRSYGGAPATTRTDSAVPAAKPEGIPGLIRFRRIQGKKIWAAITAANRERSLFRNGGA